MVSIPEGAIEGWLAHRRKRANERFQYPKVRLKVLSYATNANQNRVSIPEGAIEGLPFVGTCANVTLVSIPEGAIEGRNQPQRKPPPLERVSIPEGAIEGVILRTTGAGGRLFQYPKVRLKETLHTQCK